MAGPTKYGQQALMGRAVRCVFAGDEMRKMSELLH